MVWPQHLQINAWAGDGVDNRSLTETSFGDKILSRAPRRDQPLWPESLNSANWRDPRVGWGLVLPENEALSEQDRALALDAPAPLRKLLAARVGSPVLRYRPNASAGLIRRYYADGSSAQDLHIGASFGVERAFIPRYLLIYAAPSDIPWFFQYALQMSHYVGRLDLQGPALENYVEALIAGWPQGADVTRALAWAADDKIGAADITRKMRTMVAKPLFDAWRSDADLASGAKFLDGATTGDATTANLVTELQSHRPLMIVTTSHGMTGPLGDVAKMQADLGLLVDKDRTMLNPSTLLTAWQPSGAIWYSRACCSAGSDSETAFNGLVRDGSPVDLILKGIAQCGAMISPLPRALLGAATPLRAFIGHVEPTFDWSIAHRETGQLMTKCLVEALYRDLYLGKPVGMALDTCRRFAAQLLATWDGYRRVFIAGDENRSDLLAVKLMHNDWRAFVLIGDPTVSLPVPARND
jgi:hypothetical protein